MTLETNVYKTADASTDNINPIMWSPEAEKYIYEGSAFMPFAVVDERYMGKPGKKVIYTVESAFTMSALTEGTETPVSALDFSTVEVEFNAYGDAKQVGWEQIELGPSFVLKDIKYGALGSAIEKRDSVIVAELLTTTTTGIYPNGHDSSSVVSTDTYDTEVINHAMTLMEESQARKLEAIIIHPRQAYSLRQLQQFTDASKLGSDRVVSKGQIGEYLGVKILKSNHITTSTENTITVYKSIALGRRPFVFLPKTKLRFFEEEETKRDRAVTFSWFEMYGVKIIHNESVIVITTAGGF